MEATDFNFDPLKIFNYTSGGNPEAEIGVRLDATSTYLNTTSRASKIAFAVPAGTATVDTQLLNIVPAGSVITDVALVFTSAIDLGAAGTLSLAVGSTSGGAEICAAKTVATAGGAVTAGSVQGIGQIPATGGAAFTFVNGAVRYFTANQSLFIRSVVGTNVMAAEAKITAVVNYVTL
tara:strand:- start:1292 stop:1825 length:534 start_codon:yes stop_codon:yes gene_type:complete